MCSLARRRQEITGRLRCLDVFSISCRPRHQSSAVRLATSGENPFCTATLFSSLSSRSRPRSLGSRLSLVRKSTRDAVLDSTRRCHRRVSSSYFIANNFFSAASCTRDERSILRPSRYFRATKTTERIAFAARPSCLQPTFTSVDVI